MLPATSGGSSHAIALADEQATYRMMRDIAVALEPGDLIATGTCAGVGIGFNPPKYLQKGDVVAITIEPIGTLENPVA